MSRFLVLLPAPEAEWAQLASEDGDDLRRICEDFAARGEHVEFRRMV